MNNVLSKEKFQALEKAEIIDFSPAVEIPEDVEDISEAQDGSVVAFTNGETLCIYAVNGGKVVLPKDCDCLFYESFSKRNFIVSDIETINMSNCDTSNVINMQAMFHNCPSLTEIKGIENWDTLNVADTYNMFSWCDSLDRSEWDTSNMVNMNNMFADCIVLGALDLGERF